MYQDLLTVPSKKRSKSTNSTVSPNPPRAQATNYLNYVTPPVNRVRFSDVVCVRRISIEIDTARESYHNNAIDNALAVPTNAAVSTENRSTNARRTSNLYSAQTSAGADEYSMGMYPSQKMVVHNEHDETIGYDELAPLQTARSVRYERSKKSRARLNDQMTVYNILDEIGVKNVAWLFDKAEIDLNKFFSLDEYDLWNIGVSRHDSDKIMDYLDGL